MAKRRGHGEGSIYQRESDGLWVSVVNLGWQDGKRKRKYVYGKTRKEVADKLNQILHDQTQGLPIPTERQTVGQFLVRWHKEVVADSRATSTVRSYEQNIRLHIVPQIGNRPLAKLTGQDVNALLKNRLDSGLAPKTVRHIHTVLTLALDQAVKWHLIPRNVAESVDRPKVLRFEAQWLDGEQSRRFLEAARGDRLEALFVIALGIGPRKGELLGLKWEDVDLDRGTVMVRRTLSRVKGKGLVLGEPKTKRSRRTVHLPAMCVAALRAHRTRQLEERLLAGGRWQEQGMVFASTVGTPTDPRNLDRAFSEVLGRAGIDHIRFHDLRHTCASLLLSQGVPPRLVMDVLGHSQIGVLMDIYGHVIKGTESQAARVMDAILAAVPEADKASS